MDPSLRPENGIMPVLRAAAIRRSRPVTWSA
jgi:hypothetical protein